MTEEEWMACGEPEPMLESLVAPVDRKLRLFALACCARIESLITDPRSQTALEFATRHVETPINRQKGRGKIKKAGRAAWSEAYNEMFQVPPRRGTACLVRSCAADAAVATLGTTPKLAAQYASSSACYAVAWKAMHKARRSVHGDLPQSFKAPEFAAQAHLLRDIFGNPFRPVSLDPAWLTSDVLALARGVYDERAFDRMPILADALQDAGCANDLLSHCRDTNQVHVRGCWVVDLVLGKS